jgi:hypothetical protein
MDLTALANELSVDPLTRGYAGMTDEAAAGDLNTEYRQRNRTGMSSREFGDEIVDSEYDALSDTQKSQILALGSGENLNPFGFAENVVKDIFGVDSDTVAALAVARVETISRATELGLGNVRAGDVQRARAL